MTIGWWMMILTNKQAMMLFQIAVDSLPIIGGASPFKFEKDIRHKLVDQILNQQSEKLIDLDKEVKDE